MSSQATGTNAKDSFDNMSSQTTGTSAKDDLDMFTMLRESLPGSTEAQTRTWRE
jgi:hypothetical protein